jgi:hypothetical protein
LRFQVSLWEIPTLYLWCCQIYGQAEILAFCSPSPSSYASASKYYYKSLHIFRLHKLHHFPDQRVILLCLSALFHSLNLWSNISPIFIEVSSPVNWVSRRSQSLRSILFLIILHLWWWTQHTQSRKPDIIAAKTIDGLDFQLPVIIPLLHFCIVVIH